VAGADRTGITPLSDGLGLFHLGSSHTGTLTVGVTADREVLTDAPVYLDCLHASYEDVAAAAGLQQPARSSLGDAAHR
jgi:hypothetical protein